MNISIFTDELKQDDLAEALETFRAWGMQWVDLRNRLFGKRLEALDAEEHRRLRAMLDAHGLKTACLESGLAWDVKNGWFTETARIARDEATYIRGNARLTRVVHVKGHGALPGTPDSIPYDRVLAGLAAAGFDGAVSIETHNSKPEIDNVAFGRQILEHLRACLPGGRET